MLQESGPRTAEAAAVQHDQASPSPTQCLSKIALIMRCVSFTERSQSSAFVPAVQSQAARRIYWNPALAALPADPFESRLSPPEHRSVQTPSVCAHPWLMRKMLLFALPLSISYCWQTFWILHEKLCFSPALPPGLHLPCVIMPDSHNCVKSLHNNN